MVIAQHSYHYSILIIYMFCSLACFTGLSQQPQYCETVNYEIYFGFIYIS